jgi:hypothetical protein
MIYSVKYKKKGQFFFRTLKKVKGDFIAEDVPDNPRVFILEDETRIEIPVKDTQFIFSSKRFLLIKKDMEKESGVKLGIKNE